MTKKQTYFNFLEVHILFFVVNNAYSLQSLNFCEGRKEPVLQEGSRCFENAVMEMKGSTLSHILHVCACI